jgi:hypothetical protein
MKPAGFETAIPANERSQTHALDRAATGIGHYVTEDPNLHFTDSFLPTVTK